MQSARKIQIVLILVIAGLIAFLFFNGKNNSSSTVKERNPNNPASPTEGSKAPGMAEAAESFDFKGFEKDYLGKLAKSSPKEMSRITVLIQGADKDKSKVKALADKYGELGNTALAGYYNLELARTRKTDADLWFLAGKDFFDAAPNFNGSPAYGYFMLQAYQAYGECLKLDPKNLDAKADMGAIAVETQGNPMVGIGLLREVLQADSNHKPALMYLGVMSLRSQQFDKAVMRFHKLTELEPANPDYRRLLAEAYLAAGKAAEAKKNFEKYKNMIHDKRLIDDVDEKIKNIR